MFCSNKYTRERYRCDWGAGPFSRAVSEGLTALAFFILDPNQVLEIVRRFWREQETCRDLPADWTCKPGRQRGQNVTTMPQIFSKR